MSGKTLPFGSNIDDEARLDIVARGFWQDSEAAFFDIKVFYPFAKTHLNKNLETAFKANEKAKKTKYNARVISIEHGSFTPIVSSSCGGFGLQTSKFVSKLTDMSAEKKDMQRSVVANYIKTKVSFELIRSQVACLRGSRQWKKVKIDTGEIEVVAEESGIRE